MSLAFDDFGRPYIIMRDQGSKMRLKGIDAHKVPPFLFIEFSSDPFMFEEASRTIFWLPSPSQTQ